MPALISLRPKPFSPPRITSMVDGVDPQRSATFQHDANGNLIEEQDTYEMNFF